MNWDRVDQILAECRKETGLAGPLDPRLRDYGEFLLRHNGAEGFVGTNQYVMLWSAQTIQELNAGGYMEDRPEILIFGTNGGDTGFGIDQTTGRYVSAPLIGLLPEETRDEGGSFEEFLESRITDGFP